MFGPVSSQSGRASSPSADEVAVVGDEGVAGAAQRLPRPPDAGRRRPRSRASLDHLRAAPSPRRAARSASAAATSISASASRRGGDRRRRRRATAPRRPSKMRRSISSARPPAFRIFVSISASARVVKRSAFAVVWRCTKSSAQRRVQHPLGMRRRGLDEIAEHVVVPDLQRARCPLRRTYSACSSAITPRPSSRSRRVSSSSASCPAATRPPSRTHQRRLGDQRGIEHAPTSAACPPSRPRGRRQHLRQLAGRARRSSRAAWRQPVADRGEVARPAAVERQPRQRPLQVGHPAQAARAAARARPGSSRKCATASSRARDQRRVGRGPVQPRLQQARAAAGHRAVDGGEQRALAPAGEAAGQLQVAPRRRVDRHQPARRLAHRRPQQRQPAPSGSAPGSRRSAPSAAISARPKPPKPSSDAHLVGRRDPRPRPASNRSSPAPAASRPRRPRRSASRSSASCASLTSTSRGASRASIGPSCTRAQGADRQVAGRDVDPGEAALAAHLGEGREVVVPPRLEQALLGQRARA